MGVTVSVRGLSKSFPNGNDRLHVLRGVDLTVDEGERVAIVGESGSGKSTILSLIAGLDVPDEGEIHVGTDEVNRLVDSELDRYRSKTVGLVFQFHYLLRDFTTLENVIVPALIGSRRRQEIEAEARELLAEVGMVDRLNHLPAQLSGGERQRVALAL